MAGNRAERIARIIREEASRVILYELADPRIGFVTVTRVKVSGDLQHARIFVSVLGDQASRDETMEVLDHAVRVVKRSVGPRLKTRIIPTIEFEFDASIEGAIRVSELIREGRATDADTVSRSPDGPEPDSGSGSDAEGERNGPRGNE